MVASLGGSSEGAGLSDQMVSSGERGRGAPSSGQSLHQGTWLVHEARAGFRAPSPLPPGAVCRADHGAL